jgi:hypothetical protein
VATDADLAPMAVGLISRPFYFEKRPGGPRLCPDFLLWPLSFNPLREGGI